MTTTPQSRWAVERPASLDSIRPDAGEAIIQLSWGSTLVFVVSSLVGLLGPESYATASAGVSIAMFVAGCVLFLVAYGYAVWRSRLDSMGVGGLFFLAGSAPAGVRRSLLGSMAVQLVVAFGAASIKPFTAAAFGILAPILGLALCGLWGARFGWFESRSADWDTGVPGE
ncbi:MAG: hypothetical protein GY745_13095 [Actinomycetia bacterium]|nr:hypothetical protein [Actinomycetes bacterium]MCP3909485.1 hypothetical protein [Actinomycetes bacterium]MCP4085973.1 hypothetical protein [Actinomycetes bacterium]